MQTLVPIVNKHNTFEKFIYKNSDFFNLDNAKNIENHVQKNTFFSKFLTGL
jgi:hypothetical protein